VNVGGTTVKMSRTLFPPAARYNLLSVGQMTEEKDWIFVFDKSECRIYDAQSRELAEARQALQVGWEHDEARDSSSG